MKKKIVSLFLCMAILCFSGCEEKTENNNEIYKLTDKVDFVRLETKDEWLSIYVHKQTKVMYLCYLRYQRFDMTIMLDENGNPLLWEGEL